MAIIAPSSTTQKGEFLTAMEEPDLKVIISQKALEKGAQAINRVMGVDLLMDGGRVAGAIGLNVRKGELVVCQTKAVILTPGGTASFSLPNPGYLYGTFDFPGNRGDGYVMAYRAGASLTGMDYPRRTMLIKETCRGSGLKMESKSQKKEKITAVALFGFSLFYLISSFRLKMGTTHNLGPGFMPLLIGGLLLFCTTFNLVHVFGNKSIEGKMEDTAAGGGKNYRAIIGILSCITAYPFILGIFKFIVSTLIVAFVMLVILKPQRPIFSFLLGLGMAVASFLIFSRFLGMVLPSGFLETILFRIGG